MKHFIKKITGKQVKQYTVLLAALFKITVLTELCFAEDKFDEWLAALRIEAIDKGISESTLDKALAGLQPIHRVIELDRNQPEFKLDFWRYLELTVNELRINKGRGLLHEHRDLLEKIKNQYGVKPHFLVSIWGLETNFGTHIGNFPVIGAVATLAYDARRSKFFRAELLNALKIIDEGHIDISRMRGSWAGAMGQLQFMPSTFVDFAVDEDKDGRKDIWQSLPDVFASAANFLSVYGWNSNYTWGREVIVPQGLDQKLYGLKTEKPLKEWQEIGLRRVNGDDLPEVDIKASLIQPSGNRSPSFLVYRNYRAILRWNRSHLYALAVCHLSDRLAGSGPLRRRQVQ
jgi:membrane-bound lytic murein transglycosylase B